MPKGVMQKMIHNSFSSNEIILYAYTHATMKDFFHICVIASFSRVHTCVHVCVYAQMHTGASVQVHGHPCMNKCFCIAILLCVHVHNLHTAEYKVSEQYICQRSLNCK